MSVGHRLYAEGVAHQSPGSRSAPREGMATITILFPRDRSNPKGVPQSGHSGSRGDATRTVWNPYGVLGVCRASAPRVRLRRPWAWLCNPFGEKERGATIPFVVARMSTQIV